MEVTPSSQADNAGIKVGDVIEYYDGDLIYDGYMFTAEQRSDEFYNVKKEREIKINRNGEILSFILQSGRMGFMWQYEQQKP